MTFGFVTRLAGAAGLTLALAGCIDATVDIEVLSETTARATMTQVMGADFYAMVKMSAEEMESEDADAFCAEGELTEHEDGSATCVVTEEGTFAELIAGMESEEGGMTFTAAGPGLVRVAFDTTDMAEEVSGEEEMDAETKQMMEAFFTGHNITIKVSGREVVETNMESVDGGAQKVIPLLDLINGTADLPDELYAVVRAP
jgi:hypothetical protein